MWPNPVRLCPDAKGGRLDDAVAFGIIIVKSSSRTFAKSSTFEALLPLLVGLDPWTELLKPDRGLALPGLCAGLPVVFPAVFARFLAALDVGIEVFEFAVPFGGLLAGVASAGVSGLRGCFEAYGSAVCGRTISGLRGLRTGPDMRELPFFAVEVFVGGVADTVDAVDTTRVSGFFELCRFEGARVVLLRLVFARGLAGESCAIAELGRSGSSPAAFAFRCSAIISRRALRLAAPVALAVVAALLACEVCRDAFGLFESFSSAVFDFGSSVDIIAFAFSGQLLANVQ